MTTCKLINYLACISLTLFSLTECFGQGLQEDDPSLFHFGSSEQMLHGRLENNPYGESSHTESRAVVRFHP